MSIGQFEDIAFNYICKQQDLSALMIEGDDDDLILQVVLGGGPQHDRVLLVDDGQAGLEHLEQGMVACSRHGRAAVEDKDDGVAMAVLLDIADELLRRGGSSLFTAGNLHLDKDRGIGAIDRGRIKVDGQTIEDHRVVGVEGFHRFGLSFKDEIWERALLGRRRRGGWGGHVGFARF